MGSAAIFQPLVAGTVQTMTHRSHSLSALTRRGSRRQPVVTASPRNVISTSLATCMIMTMLSPLRSSFSLATGYVTPFFGSASQLSFFIFFLIHRGYVLLEAS